MTLTEFLGDFYDPIVGKTRMMKSGLYATCIVCRNEGDIDLKFEDGTVVEHTTIKAFEAGTVSNDWQVELRNRFIGTRVCMRCGEYATCIEYRTVKSIDIRFDGGLVVNNVRRDLFLLGLIDTSGVVYGGNSVPVSAVGITVLMNCGMCATCTEDRDSFDCDIVFEDGVPVSHIRRGSFLNGLTKHPSIGISCYSGRKIINYVGKKAKMNCGEICTVIADRGAMDIDVQFDDGLVLEHRRRDHFDKGAISYPYDRSIEGQRKMMNCGFYCAVVADKGALNIDVRFDDGAEVVHRSRSSFINCSIRHPKLGSMFGSKDSLCQRLIYYYVCKFYSNVGYSVYPASLKNYDSDYHSRGYEIDIMIWDEKVAIEFDGSVPHHFDLEHTKRKRSAIEKSCEIDRLFVVREKDSRIVVVESPKTCNISLDYAIIDDRYFSVFQVAKLILEELGNDVSGLSWDASIVAILREEGIRPVVAASKG